MLEVSAFFPVSLSIFCGAGVGVTLPIERDITLVCPTLVLVAPRVTSETVVVGHPAHTLAELQQQIHDDLRRQHPEWIGPNGESPMCDFYEARLRQLLEIDQHSSSTVAA